jgi:LacI family transcriptional regulator
MKPPSDVDPGALAKTGPSGSGVVTLEQVARAAGVSPSTVSRILNGTAQVKAEKKEAVQRAIENLGFRPNPVARGLAGGRTLSVGVVTQTISSPFYGEALHGIEDRLESAGYIPLFVSGHWQQAEERHAIDALLSRRVDGLIVLAGRLSGQEVEAAVGAELPLVLVGQRGSGSRTVSLEFDNEAGGYLATQHLLQQGHQRIALISGDPQHPDAREREQGFRRALQEAGLACAPEWVLPGDYTESGGLLAVNRLLERRLPFTAIFAANDQMAIGALLGLYRHQVRVPDDVSLVGFDDVAPARFAIPPLTTVRQSVYEVGCQAAMAMLALLDGRVPEARMPAPELVPRESTRRVLR